MERRGGAQHSAMLQQPPKQATTNEDSISVALFKVKVCPQIARDTHTHTHTNKETHHTHAHHTHMTSRTCSGRQSYAYATCDANVDVNVNVNLPAYARALPLSLPFPLSHSLCRLASTTCMNVFSIFRQQHYCCPAPPPSARHAPTLRPVPGEFLQFVSTAFQIIYRILNDAQVRRQ